MAILRIGKASRDRGVFVLASQGRPEADGTMRSSAIVRLTSGRPLDRRNQTPVGRSSKGVDAYRTVLLPGGRGSSRLGRGLTRWNPHRRLGKRRRAAAVAVRREFVRIRI